MNQRVSFIAALMLIASGCVAADPPPAAETKANEASTKEAPAPVKKSRRGICHVPGSAAYDSTTKFDAFPDLQTCLKSGGKLPGEK